jgi:hypothetical protein
MADAQSLAAAPPQPHRCSTATIEQAQKLPTFHFGPDGRIEIDTSVKVLAPIGNPASRAQRFEVLEVWGPYLQRRLSHAPDLRAASQ